MAEHPEYAKPKAFRRADMRRLGNAQRVERPGIGSKPHNQRTLCPGIAERFQTTPKKTPKNAVEKPAGLKDALHPSAIGSRCDLHREGVAGDVVKTKAANRRSSPGP